MSSESNEAELFARVDFPLYSLGLVSPRHVLVAGGGGSANTGVKNGYEIFEVTTDGELVRGESVTKHLTGEFSIYSLAVRSSKDNNNSPHSVILAAGHNQFCQLYRLSLDTEKPAPREQSSVTNRRSNGVPAGSGVQEHFTSRAVFRTEQLKRVQIDYNKKEPYGKVVRVSLNGKFLAAGGDDGHLRVFSFPDLDSVHDFATHDKEIDDIDFSPDSSKICSISKDKRAIVWDVKKGKKHAELGWDSPNNVKYLYKRVKFGCVEGDIKKYKVYTISNPMGGGSKAPSVLHRWNTQSYTVEQAVTNLGNAYSALAVSDNGNFVATGTMMEGVVDIYTAFNLSRVKRVRNSHNTFITGLEFLPTGEQSAVCRAFKEASVISISVDHQVCIHHVPELPTVSSVTAMLMVIFVLVATFVLSSFLGL